MTSNDVYVLDTSFLIDCQDKHPIDVFPGVWKNLEKLSAEDRVIIPEEVKNELLEKDDICSEFVEKNKKSILVMDSNEVSKVIRLQKQFNNLKQGINDQHYADPWVIAAAWEDAQTKLAQVIKVVVTQEHPSLHCNPDLRAKRNHSCPSRKIPDICEHLGIECLNDIEMFRKEGWKFDNGK